MKTPYRLAGPDQADSVLRGRITYERKNIVGEDPFDVPRLIEEEMIIKIDWRNRQGQELLANSVMIPADVFELRLANTEQFIPEAGQSFTSAQEDVIHNLAEQIVSQMEMPPW